MITDSILSRVKYLISDSKVYKWVRAAEPLLVQWSLTYAESVRKSAVSSPSQNSEEAFDSIIAGAVVTGYLIASVERSESFIDEVEADPLYKMDKSPHEVYNSFMRGTLDDKYYDPDHVPQNIIDSLGDEWVQAVVAHNNVKSSTGKSRGRADLLRMIDAHDGNNSNDDKRVSSIDV